MIPKALTVEVLGEIFVVSFVVEGLESLVLRHSLGLRWIEVEEESKGSGQLKVGGDGSGLRAQEGRERPQVAEKGEDPVGVGGGDVTDLVRVFPGALPWPRMKMGLCCCWNPGRCL
uniref:Uncharacterized protein n=1 Tax=Nelumbo nucifera TaxID=4432 RepID=A0A822ZVC6_NELNU|nr:TPA_asm: hypothetical protein HUJ06_017186 [Nelumbo nucifera]